MRSTNWLAALFAVGMLAAGPAIAQKTSDLPAAASVNSTDIAPFSQGSGCASHAAPCSTAKVTLAQIAAFASAALDAKLVAIAGLSPSADTCFYFTSSTAVASYTCPSFGRSIVTSSSSSAARATLGVAIGTNVQAWDADLDAIAALSGTNTLYYRSGANTWSPVTIGSNLTFGSGTLAAIGGGSGSVTSVSVTTANGVSGSVATPTTTPAITLTLGAITPSSVAASGTVTGSNLSGTNTGDQTTITGNAGTATAWATARSLSMSGDISWTLASVDGSANVSSSATLATVNSNVGSFGSSTAIPTLTVNAKGLVTAAGTVGLPTALATINGLSPANNDFLQYKSGNWANRTIAQIKADLGLPASADVQIFNASGTWTKPAFGAVTRVIAFAGGGGGGNGVVVAASTAASGGGGGGGGYARELTFSTASLGSTETITVGAGGTVGVAGGNSSFGSWFTVYGGGFGSVGQSAAGSGGGGGGGSTAAGGNASGATGGIAGTRGGSVGGSANVGGATNFEASGGGGGVASGSSPQSQGGNGPLVTPGGGTGGGGGGGLTVGNVAGSGSPGGVTLLVPAGLAGGTAPGGAGTTASTLTILSAGGAGGGGGAAATVANGGNGAAGQTPGGGGGGGGATQTGFTAGAGGTGGVGKVIVITL
jgi:hypothetical protein